jgi:hypothetical protein
MKMTEQKYKVTLWREDRQEVFSVETFVEPETFYAGTLAQVFEVNGTRWTAILKPGDVLQCEVIE